MALSTKTKILFLILAICIAFSVVFTVTNTAAILDHHCTDEDCSKCRQIEAAKYYIKTIKFAVIGLFFAVLIAFSNQIQKNYAESHIYILTPVTLKNRFNS